MLLRRATLLLSLPLAAGIALPSALAARPMTPQDVARLESTAGIAISRDGTHIAYTTLSRPDVTKADETGASAPPVSEPEAASEEDAAEEEPSTARIDPSLSDLTAPEVETDH